MDTSPDMPIEQTQGSIKKCPACGAPLGAFVSTCKSCGHELSDIEANKSITTLVGKFEEIEKSVEEKGLVQKSREKEIIAKKARVIRDFPIPNSREDLQQLIYFIQPKIIDSVKPDPNLEDWKAKFSEVLNRAKNAYKGDSRALAEFDRIEKSLNSTLAGGLQIKAKRNPLIAVALVVLLAVGIFAFISSQSEKNKLAQCDEKYALGAQTEKNRLDKLFAIVDGEFKDKKYADALTHSGQLQWEFDEPCKSGEVQKTKSLWNEKRNNIAMMIQKSIDSETADKKAEQQKVVDLANLKAEQETEKAGKAESNSRKAARDSKW